MKTRNTPIGVVVREPSAVNQIFTSGLPPKIEVWGHLGRGKLYHRIARLSFAKTPRDHLNISNRFRVISLHHFVTYIHTYGHIHTRNLDSIILLLLLFISDKRAYAKSNNRIRPLAVPVPRKPQVKITLKWHRKKQS